MCVFLRRAQGPLVLLQLKTWLQNCRHNIFHFHLVRIMWSHLMASTWFCWHEEYEMWREMIVCLCDFRYNSKTIRFSVQNATKISCLRRCSMISIQSLFFSVSPPIKRQSISVDFKRSHKTNDFETIHWKYLFNIGLCLYAHSFPPTINPSINTWIFWKWKTFRSFKLYSRRKSVDHVPYFVRIVINGINGCLRLAVNEHFEYLPQKVIDTNVKRVGGKFTKQYLILNSFQISCDLVSIDWMQHVWLKQ